MYAVLVTSLSGDNFINERDSSWEPTLQLETPGLQTLGEAGYHMAKDQRQLLW